MLLLRVAITLLVAKLEMWETDKRARAFTIFLAVWTSGEKQLIRKGRLARLRNGVI